MHRWFKKKKTITWLVYRFFEAVSIEFPPSIAAVIDWLEWRVPLKEHIKYYYCQFHTEQYVSGDLNDFTVKRVKARAFELRLYHKVLYGVFRFNHPLITVILTLRNSPRLRFSFKSNKWHSTSKRNDFFSNYWNLSPRAISLPFSDLFSTPASRGSRA